LSGSLVSTFLLFSHTEFRWRIGGFLDKKWPNFGNFLERNCHIFAFSNGQFWSLENIFWLPFLDGETNIEENGNIVISGPYFLVAISGRRII
jgi:hypothetical protein